ncbi:DNA cytosine methyltransferase [uncultured Paenibacillus sp.]|uniref:DNA cytosine methyltransferase n=1 Tax=uncultured Paenibacillus sp. TaxID=227322 RepID=UPI0015ADCB3A|nr:DNA cytosine methyltransferase [uncultured Paenibacillus sp.]
MMANHGRYPKRRIGGRREERYPTEWDAPAPTLCVGGELTQGKRSGGASSPVHPSFYEGSVEETENHVGGVPMREYPGHAASELGAPAKTVVAGSHGVPGGANCFYPERKDTVSIRNYNVTPQLPANGLTVAELFCGGGLMAVGLKAAGYDLIFANDFDKRAAQAYAHNIGDHVVCGDITSAEIQAQIPDADIIAGGPPCQDYSVAGSGAGEAGERGRLVWTYLDIIARKQPKAFVFENVKGLITKRHRPTFDALLAEFDRIGYAVSWRLINAWDYGVAQKRERVFIVGIRKDLGFTFEFPEPTAEEYRTQVLRDVIGDLPEPGEFFYVNRGSWGDKLVKSVFDLDDVAPTVKAQNMPFPPGYPGHKADAHLQNHNGARPTQEFGQRERGVGRHQLSTLDEAAYTVLASTTGGKNAFYPDNHGDQMRLATDANIIPTLPQGCTGREAAKIHPDIFWSNYARESEESAERTVTGEGKPKIHPTQPRRFTVRECLRIQSVPDWYVLPADISLSAQYRIVGNGVASRVAYRIGEALASQLSVALAEQLNVALAKQTQHERRAA